MKIYIGQTRSAKLVARLAAIGWGECTNRGELPPRRAPYFLDNGAFKDWKAGRAFDFFRWTRDLAHIGRRVDSGQWTRDQLPDFIICPDLVADPQSLAYSVDHLPYCDDFASRYQVPVYLAVQDGMTAAEVAEVLPRFGGIFVGGSLPWKLETGAEWVALAHKHGLPCHIGRVGTPDRLRWAHGIGADSVDSCLPLWTAQNMERFQAVAAELGLVGPPCTTPPPAKDIPYWETMMPARIATPSEVS